MKLTVEQVEQAAGEFEGKSVEHILGWVLETFGDGMGFMTALGYSGIVLMDHLRKLVPAAEAYFIDTGFNFPETLELLERLRNEWSINFRIVTPSMSKEELTAKLDGEPWQANADLCCLHMKVEPLLTVIHTKDAWVSALRRDQCDTRAGINMVEVDGRGVIKIYPLAAWTFDRAWDYIRRNKLPYNPLHDQGYPSVGCVYCTSPVAPGEHERAGRWNSMPKLECGIHLHRQGREAARTPAPAGGTPVKQGRK